jgi:hypothetical protein
LTSEKLFGYRIGYRLRLAGGIMSDYKIHKKLVFKLSPGIILFVLPSLLAAGMGGLNISDN